MDSHNPKKITTIHRTLKKSELDWFIKTVRKPFDKNNILMWSPFKIWKLGQTQGEKMEICANASIYRGTGGA